MEASLCSQQWQPNATNHAKRYRRLTVANGVLTFARDGDSRESPLHQITGVLLGIRSRVSGSSGRDRTLIELLLRQSGEAPVICVISGTLIDEEEEITPYGHMLLARLAHPECRLRKGEPIELQVWSRKGDDGVTYCALRNPTTDFPLKAYSTEFPTTETLRHVLITRWLSVAIDHFGSWIDPSADQREEV
ncbi:MAG: hypothetical protein ABI876_10560 [Bacteroidota bacterium]